MNQDTEHLRLLSIFHYIVAGLTALFSSFGLIHLSVGLMMLFSPEWMQSGNGQPPPPGFGLLFALMGGAFVLGGWSLAAVILVAGRFLRQRKHYLFCLIAAGLSCLVTPFGTILGVFTFIVLLRPSVKELFHPAAVSQLGNTSEGALPHPSFTGWQTDQGVTREREEAPSFTPPDWR